MVLLSLSEYGTTWNSLACHRGRGRELVRPEQHGPGDASLRVARTISVNSLVDFKQVAVPILGLQNGS